MRAMLPVNPAHVDDGLRRKQFQLLAVGSEGLSKVVGGRESVVFRRCVCYTLGAGQTE